MCSYAEREAVLKSVRYVDAVVRNEHGADSKPTIEMVRPDIIAIGVDWASKDYYRQMDFTPEWLEERGISLVYLPHPIRISSTDVKFRVQPPGDLPR